MQERELETSPIHLCFHSFNSQVPLSLILGIYVILGEHTTY